MRAVLKLDTEETARLRLRVIFSTVGNGECRQFFFLAKGVISRDGRRESLLDGRAVAHGAT